MIEEFLHDMIRDRDIAVLSRHVRQGQCPRCGGTLDFSKLRSFLISCQSRTCGYMIRAFLNTKEHWH